MSSIDFLNDLDGPIKNIILNVYVQSLKYTHGTCNYNQHEMDIDIHISSW
jgi:hypothetical protein